MPKLTDTLEGRDRMTAPSAFAIDRIGRRRATDLRGPVFIDNVNWFDSSGPISVCDFESFKL